MEELAKLFGLKVEWSNVAQFGTLIPGIASGRYDTAIIFEDIPEREKVVDLVDFYRDALAFLGPKDAPHSDQTACGKKVAVGTGNGPALLAPDLNKKLCTDQGKPAMQILNFANTDGQFSALTSKRADYVLISSTVAKLFAEKNAGFDIRSDVVAHTTRAIPVKKGDEQLQKAFVQGLQELVDNGTMKTIMEKWKTTDGFLEKVTVNVPGTVS
jgi:polar amino acid transport system substrate-binding protein